MKKIIFIISVIIILIATSFAFSGSGAIGGLLNSEDFISKYKDTPGAILVDVRTPAEFNLSHIDGAINIDYENYNFEREIRKLDISKTYFIYCRSGNRSSKAMPIMERNGIKKIYDLQGGISNAPELLK